MLRTAGEVRTYSLATFFDGYRHMDPPVLDEQQRFTYNSSTQTLDAVYRTCLKGKDGERELGNSMLSARHYDNIYD